ncbi:hypothetical protein [Sphingomonas solaris]|uniref:Uncharacterized protein n=1 Tax=Alterirhizorhabdus solaris TaxID=2529389 RepID=A0A558R7E2_9SPHN|nr:hypothetical protein [Sphingomonas solaris]TVV75310.1 hypothetical protein FOY91_07635 [Sphingomonas solaris]
MSSTTITIMRCDRCGFSADPRHVESIGTPGIEPRMVSWGKAAVAETGAVDRKRAIGGVGREGDDLCPGCVDALFAWWQATGEVIQPAPPQPVQSRPRPMFTIEDRRGLEPVLRDALIAQVAVASDAYRAEPTAVLEQGMLPEAYEGIDERATALARKVVEQLEAAGVIGLEHSREAN